MHRRDARAAKSERRSDARFLLHAATAVVIGVMLEGFFELNLSSWDVAAGALLVEEAGGRVSDWTGGPDYLSGGILAGSPAVHEALVDLASAGC